MALNDGIARFWLQQERNQATLSAIAATKAASATSSQHHPAPPTPAPAPAPAAVVRFSDDITRVDITGNGAVAERLRNNPKVRFDGERYSYRRTHNVDGKDELLSLITSFPDGLPASEVEGAYPSVLEDLNDTRSGMEVEAELKKMFHDIKLPREMLDIEK